MVNNFTPINIQKYRGDNNSTNTVLLLIVTLTTFVLVLLLFFLIQKKTKTPPETQSKIVEVIPTQKVQKPSPTQIILPTVVSSTSANLNPSPEPSPASSSGKNTFIPIRSASGSSTILP